MDKITQMKELIVELNNASNAYYNSNKSVMSDYDFDLKLEELKQLEKEIGIVSLIAQHTMLDIIYQMNLQKLNITIRCFHLIKQNLLMN